MPKISSGNTKLGNIANISLPPGLSCIKGVPCFKKGCYAKISYLRFPHVRELWDHNWKLYNKKPTNYFNGIKEFLKENNTEFFRWHVGGDIPDFEYLISMIKIANIFYNVKFLAFTKNYKILRLNMKIPNNLSIIFSAWPNYPMPEQNRFPIAFMQDGTEDRVDGTEIECVGQCDNCGMCWDLKKIGRNVILPKH